MSLIECVPNFSEGRRPEVVAAIRDAIAAVAGATVLDVSADASHNRSVITFVAPPTIVADAAFAAIREAQRRIDLTAHAGCHPRLGAADVVPFIPLEDATTADCVAIARALGRRVGDELGIPVFLYEHAATRPERRNLADVRRGGFEGLRDLVGRDPAYAPDFGPAALHPTCGAVAIGARDLLVAFNVHLGPAANLPVAREVARAVRGSSGGLRGVKALALEVDGQAQVSMNLVDVDRTTVHQAFELVRLEAEARGVTVTWSEVVGLLPERAVLAAGARHLRLARFTPAQLLERRIREERGSGLGDARWLDRLASPTPTPGVGSAAAYAGALAAALGAMCAGVAARRREADRSRPDGDAAEELATELASLGEQAQALRAELGALADADATAYDRVIVARRLPHHDAAETGRRAEALAEALVASTRVPHDVARCAARTAALALALLRRTPPLFASDLHGAVALAEAAAAAAAGVVRANIAALGEHRSRIDAAALERLAVDARAAAHAAADDRAAAQRLLDEAIADERR